MLMALVSATLLSCGSDEKSSTKDDPVIRDLMASKWVGQALDTDLLEGEKITLYFIDESHGLEYVIQEFYDIAGSKNESTIPFEYTVNENTITIKYQKYPYSSVKMTYLSTFLGYEAGEQIYEKQSLNSSDYKIIQEYQNELKQKEMQPVVEKNVKVKALKGTYRLQVEISSTLASLFPNSTIRYGIEWGEKYKTYAPTFDHTTWLLSESSVVENVYNVDNRLSPYIDSYNACMNKKRNGQTLSSEEKELLADCMTKLSQLTNDNDFIWRVVVDIDGVICYQEKYEEGVLDEDDYADEDENDEEGEDDDEEITENPDNVTWENRGTVATSYAGGKGTASDPYQISNAAQLRKLADDVENAGHNAFQSRYFKLTADIVINNNVINSSGNLTASTYSMEQWKPIGFNKSSFSGTFDGNGHTISGIYINKPDVIYVGLFSKVKGAGVVKNLTIKDSYINGKSTCGAFVGRAYGYYPVIENCVNRAVVEGNTRVGGVAGSSTARAINKCLNYGKISAREGYAGGIVGYNSRYGYVQNCINFGDVTVTASETGSVNRCGGITAFCYQKSDYSYIRNVANYGKVYGPSYVGGIFPYYTGVVQNCINIGDVTSRMSTDGAICYSLTKGTIKNAYFLNTSGAAPIKNGGTITNCEEKSSTEMKSQTFLNLLNKNAKALGSGYSQWKFGSDGYPVLEWVND